MSVLAIIISAVAVLFAWLTWQTAKRTMFHHVLEDIRKDYRSPEMHHAVKTMRDLYRTHRDNFVEEYEKRRKKDDERISNLAEEKRVEAEAGTIHFQRRLVSHFYQYVAALYLNHILPKDLVFKTWSESDLRIIPEIIVPIETKLREVLNESPLPPLDEKNFPPLVLYSDSKDYEAQKTAETPKPSNNTVKES